MSTKTVSVLAQINAKTKPILEHLEKIHGHPACAEYQDYWWKEIRGFARAVAAKISRLKSLNGDTAQDRALKMVEQVLNAHPVPEHRARAIEIILAELGVERGD